MSKLKNNRQTKQEIRAYAGQLLWAVFDDILSSQNALLQYPTEGLADDLSLEAAYQALWHFESDEHWQNTEIYYLDAQLALLKTMAKALMANQDFPEMLCNTYPKQGRVLCHSEQAFQKNCWLWPWTVCWTLSERFYQYLIRETRQLRKILNRY